MAMGQNAAGQLSKMAGEASQLPALISSINSINGNLSNARDAYNRLVKVFHRIGAPTPTADAKPEMANRVSSGTLESRMQEHDAGVITLANDLHELAEAFERLI